MKFGIIGLGNHARSKLMPAMVASGNQVSAIYSRSAEKAQNEGRKYGAQAFTDVNNLLNSGVDAVYIASPNFLHFEQAKNCLEHGKHVLLEKQMTLKNEDAEALVKLADQTGLSLAIGFHVRFHPAINGLKDILKRGGVGEVVHVSGTWAHKSSRNYSDPDTIWRREGDKAGGGSIMGTGVHVVDCINYVLGRAPNSVLAVRSPPGEVIEQTEKIVMDYSSIIGEALSSRQMNADNDLVVYGTEGTLRAKNVFSTGVQSELYHDGNIVGNYNGPDMYAEEVKAFVSLVGGQESKIARGSDGSLVVRIVNAAFDSDRDGVRVIL